MGAGMSAEAGGGDEDSVIPVRGIHRDCALIAQKHLWLCRTAAWTNAI